MEIVYDWILYSNGVKTTRRVKMTEAEAEVINKTIAIYNREWKKA